MINFTPKHDETFQGWEGWAEFCEFIQKSEGRTPDAGDSLAKHQFRIFQEGMNHAGMGWHDLLVEMIREARSFREIAIDTESDSAKLVAETLEDLLEKAGVKL